MFRKSVTLIKNIRVKNTQQSFCYARVYFTRKVFFRSIIPEKCTRILFSSVVQLSDKFMH
jgi:hypothetical protein